MTSIILSLLFALWPAASQIDQVSAEQRLAIEKAVPAKATARPGKPRKLLVVTLNVRDGSRGPGTHPFRCGNYALQLMGQKTGAYQAVFSNDVEMFRPRNIGQFDAICFNNTVGVLFEDPELRKSLLDYVSGGRGFIGIHAAGATFVQWPVYDQWPEFGEMLGGYENGGHPWKPDETITLRVEDRENPVNAALSGDGSRSATRCSSFRRRTPEASSGCS